jgi:hypothetical protein
MRDGEIQVMALLGTMVLSAALVVPTVWLTASTDVTDINKLDQMTMIEASLAVKSTKAVQPQKPVHTPDPVKQEGVSHDDKKPPPDEPKKKDEPKKPNDDKAPDLSKFSHSNDDDTPAGKPIVKIGDLNGSEFGDSAKSVGDPWLGVLLADLHKHFIPPEIAKGDSVPIGCILLAPDGKITDTKFKEKTDDDLQTAAEAALAQLTKSRNANPIEVPTQLLPLTQHYLCFHFRVKPSD